MLKNLDGSFLFSHSLSKILITAFPPYSGFTYIGSLIYLVLEAGEFTRFRFTGFGFTGYGLSTSAAKSFYRFGDLALAYAHLAYAHLTEVQRSG